MISDSEIIIGIDFGTTNCKISFFNKDTKKIEMITNEDGESIFPSIVHIKNFDSCVDYKLPFDNRFIIGTQARSFLLSEPEKTFYSIKRRLGSNDALFKIHLDEFGSEFIASLIFYKLKKIAESYFNQSVSYCVLTVPANYNDNQRQSIKDAAEISGLKVIHLINEPTAAALAYHNTVNNMENNNKNPMQSEKRVLIYDFGGGTFDVSLLTIVDNFYDIEATSGINHCGGDDIDQLLIDRVLNELKKISNIEIPNTFQFKNYLRDECEKAKIKLSTEEKVSIHFPFLKDKQGEILSPQIEIDRENFNNLAITIISKTLEPIQEVLSLSGYDKESIDKILLVGGTSNIPLVKNVLANEFPIDKINMEFNPFFVVSMGAAMYTTNQSTDEQCSIDISDISSHSYGIEVIDQSFENLSVTKIIEKNDKLPIKRKGGPFTNAIDFTNQVAFKIYQGEKTSPNENYFLGELLVNIPPRLSGEIQFMVELGLGQKFGLLEMIAKEIGTEKTYNTTFITNGSLSFKKKIFYSKILKNNLLLIEICNNHDQINHTIQMQSESSVQQVINQIQTFIPQTASSDIQLQFQGKRLRKSQILEDIIKTVDNSDKSLFNNEMIDKVNFQDEFNIFPTIKFDLIMND